MCAGSRIRARLQALSDALHKTAPGAAGIPPAFEWAQVRMSACRLPFQAHCTRAPFSVPTQSPDTVLLNLKFAHKIDTPATLGCEVSFRDGE